MRCTGSSHVRPHDPKFPSESFLFVIAEIATRVLPQGSWFFARAGIALGIIKINRKDFGLTWNAALETGGLLVGDEVTITLDVEFVKGVPASWIAVKCPLCGEHRRYLPAEVFRGRVSYELIRKPVRSSQGGAR